MADDVIAEEEESDKSEAETSPGTPDDDSKPTDRKLFKVPSQEMASPQSPSTPQSSYTWRIDLTKTEQVSA